MPTARSFLLGTGRQHLYKRKHKNMNRLLKRPILNVVENHAISYPTPANISYM